MSLIPAAMDGSAISFPPQEYSDFSTGYLEDALIEFTSKRRCLMPRADEQRNSNDDFEKSSCNFNFNSIWIQQPVENLYRMNHIERIFGFSADTKTPEGTTNSASESPNSHSSSYTEPVTSKNTEVNLLSRDPTVNPAGIGDEMRKKKVIQTTTRVVYPFSMVKPGGTEGDLTLNDINERILMPPTRAVKHPVGDFACQPCVSAQGPGLSGKAVMTLTRIHTLGKRGIITIIRTKG
ncbi:PREDICTED: uncharacterized protein LOC109339780 [Lupinus angustifolius]|uniref:uncharacterized protein LOC109339780 n=1 Tax=Lupinus angustifolius TaxID=3871 RepID=UPI00092E45EA|nr:PREDICTED: uncharacterized protein LOC109339780 [Lupinus angustifolius]